MATGGAPMSTPIQQLPPATAGGELPSDPEVLAVLSEMEAEVSAARAAAARTTSGAAPAAPSAAPSATPMPPYGAPPHGAPAMPPGCYFDARSGGLVCGGDFGGDFGGGGLWDARHAQNAAIAAVVALALFYPASLEAVYQKIPVARLAALFSSHDKLVRAALFAVVIYALLMKVVG